MKVCVFTLGCKVNRYESDVIINKLIERGFEVTENLEKADYYVINTCAVRAHAEMRILGNVGALVHKHLRRDCGSGEKIPSVRRTRQKTKPRIKNSHLRLCVRKQRKTV